MIERSTLRQKIIAAALSAACTISAAPRSEAYSIDCAILLCLAGGFPASRECSAARLEILRRVTPFPIEPPLQLWNCPMRVSGAPFLPNMGPDGLTPEIRLYRDGIEIFHVSYDSYRNSDGVQVTDATQRGTYGEMGEFSWQRVWLPAAPAWVQNVVGFHSPEQTLRARGVALRMPDYRGEATIEWIEY